MKKARKHYKLISVILGLTGLLVLAVVLLHGNNIAVLNPKGSIAQQQRNLIIFATLLSLLVVLPVYILTFVIAWKYRASNKKARYEPRLDGNRKLEFIWWAIPCAIIAVLAVVTWKSSHALDPFRPLESTTKPVTVQVVALQWKWLFIYPDHGIASVNEVRFPEKTPVNFHITADAPMNSFWIPQLGGQVYAMAGMTTKLHLIADESGSYAGSSANISGKGFANMKFTATATSQADFDSWVQSVKHSPNRLTTEEYAKLAAPGTNSTPIYYVSSQANLYDTVVKKYMVSGDDHESMEHTYENDHEKRHHH